MFYWMNHEINKHPSYFLSFTETIKRQKTIDYINRVIRCHSSKDGECNGLKDKGQHDNGQQIAYRKLKIEQHKRQ
jgi:hypothetical protein